MNDIIENIAQAIRRCEEVNCKEQMCFVARQDFWEKLKESVKEQVRLPADNHRFDSIFGLPMYIDDEYMAQHGEAADYVFVKRVVYWQFRRLNEEKNNEEV